MRGLMDCHTHTRLCGHASGSAVDYAAEASRQGLAGLIVTEHLPLPDELDANRTLSLAPGDVEIYLAEAEEARRTFPDLTVITGIEADWLPDRTGETKVALDALLGRDDGVRVVLGSVHFLGSWAFDDPGRVEEWEGRDVAGVWEHYVSEWCDAATSGLFDVMAHPDLPKKFGHHPEGDVEALYRRLARSAAQGGVLIEVSTAGLRKPVGELYPSAELLRAFREESVPATLGSDAHRPSEVGFGFEEALDALRRAGYERVTFPVSRTERRSVAL